jgi:hypothetical protein
MAIPEAFSSITKVLEPIVLYLSSDLIIISYSPAFVGVKYNSTLPVSPGLIEYPNEPLNTYPFLAGIPGL